MSRQPRQRHGWPPPTRRVVPLRIGAQRLPHSGRQRWFRRRRWRRDWSAGWLSTLPKLAVGQAEDASTRLPAFTMMFGNFITGVAILGPAGMLVELATGLSVTIRDAGAAADVRRDRSLLRIAVDGLDHLPPSTAGNCWRRRWASLRLGTPPQPSRLTTTPCWPSASSCWFSPRSIRRRPRARSP